MKPTLKEIENIIDDHHTRVLKNGTLKEIFNVNGFVSSVALRRLIRDFSVYQSSMNGLRIGSSI